MSATSPNTMRPRGAPIPRTEIDSILTAQLAVAWAGEKGDDPRLGWWRSDLVSEFGGEDLFRRLLPHSWEWAVLQGAREAARRQDESSRSQNHDPDRLLSLFRLGFEIDERVEERLIELKGAGKPPFEALPGLKEVIGGSWEPDRFAEWINAHGKSDYVAAPGGRRLKGEPPESLTLLMKKLLGALSPLGGEYSLPHFRRAT